MFGEDGFFGTRRKKVCRWSGGESSILKEGDNYVSPDCPPKSRARSGNSIPPSNTMRFLLETYLDPEFLKRCAPSEPDFGQPGGREECQVSDPDLDLCHLIDTILGEEYDSPCDDFVGLCPECRRRKEAEN